MILSIAGNLDKCMGTSNTLNDLSNKVCVLNKTEDLSLGDLNMIARLNKSKILTKHILCKCRFEGRKCNSI